MIIGLGHVEILANSLPKGKGGRLMKRVQNYCRPWQAGECAARAGGRNERSEISPSGNGYGTRHGAAMNLAVVRVGSGCVEGMLKCVAWVQCRGSETLCRRRSTPRGAGVAGHGVGQCSTVGPGYDLTGIDRHIGGIEGIIHNANCGASGGRWSCWVGCFIEHQGWSLAVSSNVTRIFTVVEGS